MSQLILPLKVDTSYEESTFIVADSNKEAYMHVQSWPKWSAHGVIIYGNDGAGKTHLSEIWRNRTNSIQVDLKGNLADQLSTGSCVVLDDIDIRSFERELFHLYNYLKENSGYFILTLKAPVLEYKIDLPDLRSRLLSLPQFEIKEPSDDLLKLISMKVFADHQLRVSPAVIDYIIPRIERSFSALRKLLNTAIHESQSKKKPITTHFMRQILEPQE